MNPDKTIDRAKKILRKADPDQNPSEAERNIALAMAQELLIKNGLSMADVGEINDTDDREFIHGRDEAIQTDQPWQVELAQALAAPHFVRIYRMTGYKKGHASVIAIGRREHVAIYTEVFNYVRDQIAGMAAIEVAKRSNYPARARQFVAAIWGEQHPDCGGFGANCENEGVFEEGIEAAREYLNGLDLRQSKLEAIADRLGVSPGYAPQILTALNKGDVAPEFVSSLKVWRNSFYSGAIAEVGRRVREAQKQETAKAEGDTGTALVRQESKLVTDFMDSLNLGLRASARSQRQYDGAGARSGKAAGSRADISGAGRKVGGGRGQLGSGS